MHLKFRRERKEEDTEGGESPAGTLFQGSYGSLLSGGWSHLRRRSLEGGVAVRVQRRTDPWAGLLMAKMCLSVKKKSYITEACLAHMTCPVRDSPSVTEPRFHPHGNLALEFPLGTSASCASHRLTFSHSTWAQGFVPVRETLSAFEEMPFFCSG